MSEAALVVRQPADGRLVLTYKHLNRAAVAELVYARDSKSRSARIVGSSPTRGTIQMFIRRWHIAREPSPGQLVA